MLRVTPSATHYKRRPFEVGFECDPELIERSAHNEHQVYPHGRSQLVMEAIIETKASVILQFICMWPLKKEPGRLGCSTGVRPTEDTRHGANRVRSTKKRANEGRRQERQN
jgi:hypothetical protein